MTPINDVHLAWDIIDEGMAETDAGTVAFGLSLLRRAGSAVPTCWPCGDELSTRDGNLCDTHRAATERTTRLDEVRRVLAVRKTGRETEPECPRTDSLGERLHLWDVVENEHGERFQVSVDLPGWCLVSEWNGMHWAFDDEAFDEIRLVRGCVEAPEEAPELLTSNVDGAGEGP